jgi:hypothetical protein
MSQDERRELARALAAIDLPHVMDPRVRRRRQLGLMLMAVCCIGLAGWIAVLILTLPARYTSHDWRVVWVGLDIAELLGFAATAWAAWHQRQVVIFCMIITGTLLVCDAWFDLALDYGSSGFTASVLSAVFAEFPLAFIMFAAAMRLVRVTVQTLMQLAGITGTSPPLWRVPLLAAGLEEALPALLRQGPEVSRHPRLPRPRGHEDGRSNHASLRRGGDRSDRQVPGARPDRRWPRGHR